MTHLSNFNYDLPETFIAQTPVEPRDSSKLMHLNRADQSITHHTFRAIQDFLHAGDVLVLNNTRVIPARLHAQKPTGGQVEILLLRQMNNLEWRVLIGGRHVTVGMTLTLPNAPLTATVLDTYEGAERLIRFSEPVMDYLHQFGEMPLPPYIQTRLDDAERYQTIYSRHVGSAAAPTAGLHFTPELFLALKEKGVQFAYCTLHIGLDTFLPVRAEEIETHQIHSEFATLATHDAEIINRAKLAGSRVIAVGTTAVRTLETAAILSAGGDPRHPEAIANLCPWRPVTAFAQDTQLFIYPGFRWRVTDAIITNFHLPKSTLLMLVSAFAGREFILHAYETAKAQQYRFFSFGDAMLIT